MTRKDLGYSNDLDWERMQEQIEKVEERLISDLVKKIKRWEA